MKIKTEHIYICEYCGKESRSANEIEECELLDTGLNSEEMRKWKFLNEEARRSTMQLALTNNEAVKKWEDAAYKELTDFEKAHNLNEEQIKKNIAKRKLQTIGILDENGEIVRALRDILTNKG